MKNRRNYWKNIEWNLLIIYKIHGNDDTILSGEGFKVTLKDVDDSQILDSDLLIIVNELKGEGAKAISINGQRIVNSTAITYNGNTIQVNNQRIVTPFVIKATGSKSLLDSSMKNGYLYNLKKEYGILVEYEKLDEVTIEAYL